MSISSASPGPPWPARRYPARALWLSGVALIAALVYANALPNEFVWDDVAVVEHNQSIRKLGYVAEAFSSSYWKGTGTRWQESHYRPLTVASYAVSWAVAGSSPPSFRAVNVALHAGCAVLVSLLALELGLAWWGALFAGLLFAVHPANVEAVAWIVGRAEVAAAFCSLATLLIWLRAFRGGRKLAAAAAGGLLLAGLLFKESAAPAVGIAVALGLVAGQGAGALRLRRALVWALPLLLALVAYFALRRAMLGPAHYADAVYFAGAAPHQVFLTMTKVVAYYLKLLVLPIELRAHYDLVDVRLASSLLEPRVLAAFLFELVLLAATVWGLAARRRAAAAGAWILLALAPYLHLVPFQWLMAERFLYLASAGFAVLVALGADELTARVATAPAARRALLATGCLLLVALGTRTVVRNRDWADEVVFFGKMTKQEPDLAIAHVMLGGALSKRGRIAEAMEEFRIASSLGWRP